MKKKQNIIWILFSRQNKKYSEAVINTVAIILVSYRQKQNFQLLYSSLQKQSFKDFVIYFVDNNPDESDSDESKKLNESCGFNITYIMAGYNSGFAGGNNLGALKAIKDGCKYIFFLNNDSELEPKCIEELVKTAESDEDTGVAAPIIFYGTSENPKITVQEFGASADFKKYKIHKYFEGSKLWLIKDSLPAQKTVDLVSGGACFVKSEVLEKTGLWEESYFAYGDEIDLAKRVKEAGYKTAVSSAAMVWHNHKWEKSNKYGYYFEYYLIQRNKYLYFRKFGLTLNMFISLCTDWIKFPWRLIWFIKVCDFSLGIYYLKGTLHGLLNKKGKPDFVK